MTILRKLHKLAVATLIAATAAFAATSCSAIYDDLPECTSGARLRFIYDYNMEYANSFMHNVDCLTVYFFDNATGSHVATRTVEGAPLADENYRMDIDLPAGSYRAVAYGGIGCEQASFSHTTGAPANGSHFTQLDMLIHPEHLDESPEAAMHNLFWGAVEFTIVETLGTRTEATVEMIKDTNSIRVILQHVSGKPVNHEEFKFEIIDDNTLMAHDNSVVPNGEVTYSPWASGSTIGGYFDNGTPITNAYAELSVARLIATDTPAAQNPANRAAQAQTKKSPVLRVSHLNDKKEVDKVSLEIPLVSYLDLLRHEQFNKMDQQEFLDRESRWSLLFLLNENDMWHQTEIKVNDWTVRVNDIKFEPNN